MLQEAADQIESLPELPDGGFDVKRADAIRKAAVSGWLRRGTPAF